MRLQSFYPLSVCPLSKQWNPCMHSLPSRLCAWVRRPLNPATSEFQKEALRNDLQPVSTAQINRHSVYYLCESINFYVFQEPCPLHPITSFYWWGAHCIMILPWSGIEYMPQAEEFAVLKIYDAASTDSVTHSNSTLITQEPSNLPACSCSNLSLLFIKCVTMNRRVLSEWQFNFHRLHYGPPIPSNVSQCTVTCVAIGDIFIHNNISAFWVRFRLLKIDVFKLLVYHSTFFFFFCTLFTFRKD